jgi:ribosomal protein L35
MPKMKTRKTLLKRLRVTKRGKILKRYSKNGHLKIKSDSSTKSRKKHMVQQRGVRQLRVLKKLLAKHGKGVNK